MSFNFVNDIINALNRNPDQPVGGEILGVSGSFEVCIPGHAQLADQHYGALGAGQKNGTADFRNFGVRISLDEETELIVNDEERVLVPEIRNLVKEFGAVFIVNGLVEQNLEFGPQKNIFPDLSFHIDRGMTQPNRYSLYTRDSRDPDRLDAETRQPIERHRGNSGPRRVFPGTNTTGFSPSLDCRCLRETRGNRGRFHR